MEFLEIFKCDHYEDISATEWMAHLPPGLVAAHLKIDEKLIATLPKDEQVIVPA